MRGETIYTPYQYIIRSCSYILIYPEYVRCFLGPAVDAAAAAAVTSVPCSVIIKIRAEISNYFDGAKNLRK